MNNELVEFNGMDKRMRQVMALLPDTDDITLVALKGHLLTEEILESIIHKHCRDPQVLEDIEIGFFVKARLVQALIGEKKFVPLWRMVEALNSLRNELAHKLQSDKVDKKLKNFLDRYYETELSGGFRRPNATFTEPIKELQRGVGFVIGALSSIEERIDASYARKTSLSEFLCGKVME